MRTAAFGVSAAALAIAVFAAGPASASEFQVGQVDITTQVTISAGFGVRMADRD